MEAALSILFYPFFFVNNYCLFWNKKGFFLLVMSPLYNVTVMYDETSLCRAVVDCCLIIL